MYGSHIFFNGWTLFRTAHHMTFFALNNHSKRTYRFWKGDKALLNHTSSKRTWHWWFKKKENFFRLALRARHDYVLPNHTFEENLTVQEIFFLFRFALRAHHDNFVSNQNSERTCSLTIKKGFFSGSRYALALIIFCLYYTLWKGFFLLEFDLTFY